MTDRLDHLVARLAAAPTDRSLEAFEAQLAADIRRHDRAQNEARVLAPIGLASVAVALALGVTVGGMTAAISTPPADRTLLTVAALAPSSLLESQP
jgi:hypothetical protein